MSRRLAVIATAFLTSWSAAADSHEADAPASAPATAPNGAVQQMKIVVAEVKGLVQVRVAENAPWKAAKEGMELDEGAEFRTGPRSSVTCQIPPDQTLTLDRLGTVKIAEAIKSGNKIKTDMVMKYGRTHYDIEAAGAEHESTIRSPSSTLAVRGTEVSLYDQPPFTPVADSIHGRASFRNAQRQLRFGGKTFTQVANDKSSVAETALAKQTVDPRFAGARTASELAYIANETDRGATIDLNSFTQIPVVRNGPGPLTDAELAAKASSLPGTLDIVLRWTGNANINLFVGDQGGNPQTIFNHGLNPTELLFPGGGFNHGASGGTIPYDDRGGPRGGMEIAYWGSNFPHGVYGVSAVHESGPPADVKFNIFLNGKPLDNLQTFEVDAQGNLVTDANGLPILIRNSQIERTVAAPSRPSAPFGPKAGVTSILSLIPSVPALDDPIPVEPPPLGSVPPSDTGAVVRSSMLHNHASRGGAVSHQTLQRGPMLAPATAGRGH